MQGDASSSQPMTGIKHDRDGVSEESLSKRRVVLANQLIEEYKQHAAEHQRIAALREPLERQRDELELKLKAIPMPKTPLQVHEDRIRRVYRANHAIQQSVSDGHRQACPWCHHVPKKRTTSRGLVCKNCNTVYHCCDGSLFAVAKGKAEDCLGCCKPIL